ncbi:hydroxypyruvate isomerase [Maricurvus nonylphenolicus]|uniref:hydroxypyruvate isomerase family protein n=1 Tax=Maricurvus nonylphenolicus TaxID=1008307 RepID=UPI0036F4161F
MKFCANLSLLFTEVDLLKRFDAAREEGFTAVEIQFPYEAELSELVNAQQANELSIALINVPTDDLMSGGEGLACVKNKRDKFKQAVDQCLAYAEALQVDCVNILPGRSLEEKNRQYYRDTLMENLDYAADQLASINVLATFEAINTEDMPGFLIHSTQQMRDLLADINHRNLAMQYDIYHMAKMNEPVAEQLQQLLHSDKICDRIGHLQFADTPQRGEPASGELDFNALFSLIEQSPYQGWLGAEYKPTQSTAASLQWFSPYKD